jgi:hypothetical protein
MFSSDPSDSPFGASVLAASSPVRSLLTEADRVGGIYRLAGFHEALVVTNDAPVFNAFGVPQYSFLLAAVDEFARPELAGAHDPDDEEVLLLRVINTAPLSDEAEGQRMRAHATREMLTQASRTRPANRDDIIDELIEQEMQTAGLRCHVLGTFFDVHESGSTRLKFGSDLDALYAYSRYGVYKPYGRSLEFIVSYLEGVRSFEQPGVIELGHVRYASTTRREARARRAGKSTFVPVRVNIDDFVAHKTAVFGTTRLGKSNTLRSSRARPSSSRRRRDGPSASSSSTRLLSTPRSTSRTRRRSPPSVLSTFAATASAPRRRSFALTVACARSRSTSSTRSRSRPRGT